MKLPLNNRIRLYGDTSYRGECPLENAELITFIHHMNIHYRDIPVLHIKNEGKRTYRQSLFDRAIGALHTGACDIIIPGSPGFCLEIKRQDHTKSNITEDQINFLLNSNNMGAFVCVALGHKAAISAFTEWKHKYVKTN